MAAALSAAAPGRHAVSCRWDSAYVSGTVMSHAKGLPLAHGRSVTPSGRLSSCHIRLIGSLTAGICALFIIIPEKGVRLSKTDRPLGW